MKYPDNKNFIFTIFDDTDVATVGNISPVYDFLHEIGMLTTKSVWPLHCSQNDSDFAGSQTLEDPSYADYIKKLSVKGFEIAFHGASMETSSRGITLKALKKFNKIMGFSPKSYACHAGNKENLYWGEDRFSFLIFKKLYKLLNNKKNETYYGNNKKSKYFWGDICYDHFDYVRTFTYNNINLKKVSKNILYSSLQQPYIKSCFITSDADNVEEFNRLICTENQQRLETQRGICILSTHFGKGFVKNNVLHSQTRQLLEQLSKRNGWFVPVSNVLDFLKDQNKREPINQRNLFALELKWFLHSVQRKFTKKKYEKTELEYLSEK